MTTITVLGCGSSLGVPVLGCNCQVCISPDFHNKRTRCAIIISCRATNILVDCGPDIRTQLLREGITSLAAVVITHDHNDHTAGLDDIRLLSTLDNPLKILSTTETLSSLTNRYHYLFPKILQSQLVDYESSVTIQDIELHLIKQNHGDIMSLGIRCGKFAYLNDLIDLANYDVLRQAKIWLIDCINYTSTYKHAGLDLVLKWQQEYRPEKVFLTNLSHKIGYYAIQSHLPANVWPAYDGLKISL